MEIERLVSDLKFERDTKSSLETRLRDLEKANWKSTGALAVFMVVLQIIVTVVAKNIH